MPLRHRLLAALVAALWGVNFLAIHASLQHFPPFTLVALRWTLLAIPALLFVRRPAVPWRLLLGYGLGFGVGQFVFLYSAMAAGMPTGLASLVLQASAPFTVLLAVVFLGERLGVRRGLGVLVALVGLALVGVSRWQGATPWPFVLTVLGGLSWAVGNVCSRRARAARPFDLMMWMTVVPPLPMWATALVLEGPDRVGRSLATAFTPGAGGALLGLLYTCLPATVLASGIWTWLLSRHPASSVGPFSLLVPVVGLSTAWLALGEQPSPLEVLGGVGVVVGVLVASSRPRRERVAAAAPAEPVVPEPLRTTTG